MSLPSPSSYLTSFTPGKNVFQMVLLGTRPVLKGSEVFNHYGELTTDRMLLDYSFTSLEANFVESITVEMPLTTTKFLELKRDVWDGSELDLDHFVSISHFMQFFRIVACENEKELVDTENASDFFRYPISYDRERQALERCSEVLNQQVPGETTLAYDMYILENDPTLSIRKRMALQYRITRKRLFSHFSQFCTRAIDNFLNCIAPSFDRAIAFKQQGEFRKMLYLIRLQRFSRSSMFPASF
jgi:hypothetical protein